MDFSRRIFMSAAPMLAAGAVTAGPAFAASGNAFLPATDLGLKPDAKGDQSTAFRKALVKAAEHGGVLLLPAGTYHLSDIRIDRPAAILGIRGLTRLIAQAVPAYSRSRPRPSPWTASASKARIIPQKASAILSLL